MDKGISRTNRSHNSVGNDLFPTEIFYSILEFYTSSLKGLMTFKTICKSWKYIGETSIIWLSCKLMFSAPMIYHMYCYEDEYAETDEHILSVGTIESKFRRVTIVKIETSPHSELVSGLPLLDQSKAYHDCFLANLRGYNMAWKSYASWTRFSDRMRDILGPLLAQAIVCAHCVGPLASVLSAYLLQNLSFSSKLTLAQQMGFFCRYLILVLYLFRHIVGWMWLTAADLCTPTSYLEIHVDWKQYLPSMIPSTLLIGLFATVILIHLKFTSCPEIPWIITTIPLWVMILLRIVLIILIRLTGTHWTEGVRYPAFVCFLLILTVLPLTLLGYSSDNSNENRSNSLTSTLQLKYMSLFYFPHAMALTAILVTSLYEIMQWFQRKKYKRPTNENKRKCLLRLLLFSCSLIGCVFSCFLFYILLVSVWKRRSPLSSSRTGSIQPVGLLFWLLACLHVSFAARILGRLVDEDFAFKRSWQHL
jgi:hypothetical protein